jgi:hypothetical protein
MFQRVIHQDWAAIIPIISFVITAGFFIAISIRAIRLGKAERDHLANIPLEDGDTSHNI